MDIELVIDAHAIIGEAPTWVAPEQVLYWADVRAPALHRFDPATGQTRSWKLPSEIGGFAMMPGEATPEAALVALRTGLFGLDLQSGELAQLAPPPFDPARHRFNEAACDSTGRFWIGTMFDPADDQHPEEECALFSFTLGGGLRPEPDASTLHNGMAWSPDGRSFYLTHSQTGEILAFPFDPDSGRLGPRRVFARIPSSLGVPDGAAVDVEGGYWCAIHGASRLRRFTSDGSFDRDVMLPVSQPTMAAFAGPELDTLYVTSAAEGLDEAQMREQPHAGGLFRFKPGISGAPKAYIVR